MGILHKLFGNKSKDKDIADNTYPMSKTSKVEPLSEEPSEKSTEKTQSPVTAIPSASPEQPDNNQSLFETCEDIIHCNDMETQVTAIAKLNDRETLNTLVKHYKGKKKKLYRAAKNRLNIIKTRTQHTEALQQQFDVLAQSAKAQTLSITAVLAAEKQLTALADELPDTLKLQHQKTLEKLIEKARHIEVAKNARQAVLNTLSQVHEAFTNGQFKGSRSDFNAQMNAQQQAWLTLPEWQTAEAKSLDIRFEQLLSRANTAASHYFNEQHHYQAQKDLLEQCESWLKNKKSVTPDKLAEQEKRWQALGSSMPVESSEQKIAQNTFDSLISQLREQSQQLVTAQKHNDIAIHTHIEAFAAALEDGELKVAQRLQTAIRDCLHSEAGVSKNVYQNVSGRIKRLENRLNELKQWQHFGEDHVRQDLINALQTLAQDKTLDILDKAEQIKAIQQQWKNIKGRAPQALWEQFRMLGDMAWAPCADYFKAERNASKSLLKQRMDFLSEAQAHLQAIDWDNPNWKALSEAHKKFETVWHNFPKLQDKEYRKAKKAHDAVVKQWDNHLDAERKREKKRRQTLIEQAEALQANDNTTDTIAIIKDLQQQWTPTLGLKRRAEEQALWIRFKTACDAIFAKHHQQREAQREAKISALEAHRQRLNTLADDLTTSINDNDDFETIKTQFHEAIAALPAFDDVPEKAARALQAQQDALLTRFDQYQHEILLDKRLDYLTQLNDQDLLCIQVEHDKLPLERLETLSSKWQTIKPLLNDGQATMRKRFEQAVTAQQQRQLPVIEENVIAAAQEICLLLELAADLPGPDYAQHAREQLRLTILDASMNGDKSFERLSSEAGLYDITVRWYTLSKGSFDETNSGDTLLNWRARFDNSVKQIRLNNQLKQRKN